MDFFVLILFSVFVYLIPGNDKDYLAVQSTSGMKGVMAIMIISGKMLKIKSKSHLSMR